MPRDCDDYIHRIGRTARAGTTGRAITFVSEEEQLFFKQIEDFIEQEVPKIAVPEELGEAPAYEPKKKDEKKKGNDRNRNRRNNNGKPHAKKGKGKPHNKQKENKAPVTAQQGANNGEKPKPKHNRRHHRPKKKNGEYNKTE